MSLTSEGPDPAGPVRLGVAGLGRGFMLTLPSLRADPRIRLVAAAARREDQRRAFAAEFGGRAHGCVADLAADPDVEAIYIATPHQMHAEHAALALAAGKHVLVDKPLAVTIADGTAMVAAARAAGRHLIVGPSHSFDGPVAQAAALIGGGGIGQVRMIQAFNWTDFLYRPRRPEELVTDAGGGVVFSQAVHQIDVVRLLAGGMATSVFARTGAWDAARPTEGAYAALIGFAGGAFATLAYSGYGRFDSDEWMGWVGELGAPRSSGGHGRARRALAGAGDAAAETALKAARSYGA
ncbi:MAG: Gfo/Idh/MocA family protein, partial [Gemmobacter sp.]